MYNLFTSYNVDKQDGSTLYRNFEKDRKFDFDEKLI